MIKEIHKINASNFVYDKHYSPVMPKLTKHFCGYFVDGKLVGIITFGWGTRPKHTIQKLFPQLDTKDYFEIGKMCMDDSMPRNSETQMLSCALRWLKQNKPDVKFLFTWADGLVGKVGYVYQAFNMFYGGYAWTDTYVTKSGEKIHPRTIQEKKDGLICGSRPDFDRRIELGLSRVKGKQFRYIIPTQRRWKKLLKTSTENWTNSYPKDKDLLWKILKPGEEKYKITENMPFSLNYEAIKHNTKNIRNYKSENSLEKFF
tara:strand:- start:33345 stop:34121 length:777 start_codon:yes stop_codon:yes gene_type:complete